MNVWETITDLLDVLSEWKTLPKVLGGGVLGFLGSIPDMIRLWFKIKKLAIDAEHLYEVAQMIPVVNAAIKKAHDTGDTSDLEALFGRPKSPPPAA